MYRKWPSRIDPLGSLLESVKYTEFQGIGQGRLKEEPGSGGSSGSPHSSGPGLRVRRLLTQAPLPHVEGTGGHRRQPSTLGMPAVMTTTAWSVLLSSGSAPSHAATRAGPTASAITSPAVSHRAPRVNAVGPRGQPTPGSQRWAASLPTTLTQDIHCQC